MQMHTKYFNLIWVFGNIKNIREIVSHRKRENH